MSDCPPFLPGDVLAFGGRDCLSRLIRVGCLGPISHVGLIVNNKGVPVLAEALTKTGLTFTPVAEALKRPGKVWHYPLHRPLNGPRSKALTAFANDLLGTPYDFTDVLGARTLGFGWLSHLVGALGYLPDYRHNHKLFCSEWVAIAHNRVGLTSFRYPSHWNPTHQCRYERWIGVLREPILRGST